MSSNLVVRATGWTPIAASEIEALYVECLSLIDNRTPDLVISYQQDKEYKTLAESHGVFVRDTFECYQNILQEMKSSRNWVALQVHSNNHTAAVWSDTIKINDFEVRGEKFDPISFVFNWRDNSLELPFKAWNWNIDFFSEDYDDSHYFFDSKTKRVIACDSSIFDTETLKFFGFAPKISTETTSYKILK